MMQYNSHRETYTAKEFEGENLDLRAWLLLHRTRDLFFRCEDRVLAEFGISTEQYEVLLAIKSLAAPVRLTDIGRFVGHKVNTVSMIIDRMVEAGLVDRLRDLPDRRAVRLVITDKGNRILEPTAATVSRVIGELMSPISDEEKHSLIRLLETLRRGAIEHTNLITDIRNHNSYEIQDMACLIDRVIRYA